jgi:hypothetical protein
MGEVERAFVHIDFETAHYPEHADSERVSRERRRLHHDMAAASAWARGWTSRPASAGATPRRRFARRWRGTTRTSASRVKEFSSVLLHALSRSCFLHNCEYLFSFLFLSFARSFLFNEGSLLQAYSCRGVPLVSTSLSYRGCLCTSWIYRIHVFFSFIHPTSHVSISHHPRGVRRLSNIRLSSTPPAPAPRP